MANTKLSFLGAEGSDTEKNELQAFCNSKSRIFITITDPDEPHYLAPHICLDKATAVKFVKNLKSEISKMWE